MSTKNYLKKRKMTRGFALIEALTVLFIFSLITITFYQVFSLGARYIIESKNRLGAISLANERMEMVRNLNYSNIGTKGGEVGGNILQEQDVSENGRTYKVKTRVAYIQDSLDGIYPADTAFEDYKKVTINVSWGSDSDGQREVELASRFVPSGLEVANPNDGILSINIFSDQPGGTGIPHSTVHVVNPETGLDTELETDNSGNLTLMGSHVAQSIQKYEITASKNGYETVSTMPPYPSSPYNPINAHASVVLGSVNVANIVQNELSDLKIRTENGLGQDISGIDFTLIGGRILGTGATFPYDPVYSFNNSYVTGSNGEKDFNDIGPGYFVMQPSIPSEYELINITAGTEFTLFSSSPLANTIKLAPKNLTSLLVKVQKDESGILKPVSGATVQLANASGYDATVASASNGAAYFPVSSDLFLPGDYELKINASGFSENISTVAVNQDELLINFVTLSP
jgi:hypothetical protein